MSIELEQFLADARTLAPAAFAARRGRAFLVRSSGDGDLENAGDDWSERTNPMRVRSTNYSIPRLTYAMSRARGSEFYVYPLRKRKPGPADAPITIGRSIKRDVRIEDLSVSNLHAYLVPVGEGEFNIVDKASRNGTRMSADFLKPGAAHRVPEGAILEFGRVRTTFMTAPKLVEFVLDVLS